MKNRLSILVILLVSQFYLVLDSYAEPASLDQRISLLEKNYDKFHRWGGPFLIDAHRSNEGVIEMLGSPGNLATIVFKGCDKAVKIRDSSPISALITASGKSVTVKNTLSKDHKEEVIGTLVITTAQSLTHEIVFVFPGKAVKEKSADLKTVIDYQGQCKQ